MSLEILILAFGVVIGIIVGFLFIEIIENMSK